MSIDLKKIKDSIHLYVSRIILVWIVMISIFIASAVTNSNATSDFYKSGPNPTLVILGITIDNPSKYAFVIAYCIINSVMRNAYADILRPWLINHIQNNSVVKPDHIAAIAYEVTFVTTLYGWFDWVIYMNILLAQIDLVIIEFVCDIVLSTMITSYYLHNKPTADTAGPGLSSPQSESTEFIAINGSIVGSSDRLNENVNNDTESLLYA